MTDPIPGYVEITVDPTGPIVAGTAVTFSAAFGKVVAGVATPADPARVAFVFDVDEGTPTTYVYGTDAELVKDAVGAYHVTLDSTGMAVAGDKATLTGEYIGDANGIGTIEVTDFTKVLVMGAPLPDPFG